MAQSNITQPYTKRAVPASSADLPAWLKAEFALVQRAIPNYGHAVIFGDAAPTTGTWGRGDIVFDNTPTAGSFIGWVCTTAGTPGTWKTWGAISP